MTKQNKNQKPEMSMEEALEIRTSEPSVEELTQKAMSDMRAEETIANLHVDPDAIPLQKLAKKETTVTQTEFPVRTISNQPEMVTQDIPVLSTDPLPKVEASTRESPEIPPQEKHSLRELEDSNLRKLREYIHGPEISVNWVQLQLTHLSRIPSAIPSMTLWAISPQVNIPKAVYAMLLMPGYLENIWPGLKLVMGTSQDNVEWATGVATTMAMFDVIKMLPYATRDGE